MAKLPELVHGNKLDNGYNMLGFSIMGKKKKIIQTNASHFA